MANLPDVRRFYWLLAGLLAAGLLAATITLAFFEPGPGSISVAGATMGIAVAAAILAIVLFACLWFMHRITLVIAAAGGPITSHRYRTLTKIMGAGMIVALIVLLVAKPRMDSSSIGQLIGATSTALLVLGLVMAAFLAFLRRMVKSSALPNAQSLVATYRLLGTLGLLGLAVGAVVLFFVNPGQGPFHVAGSAIAVTVATVVMVGVMLALLVYLGITVEDAIQAARNPARGKVLHAEHESGRHSDPGVVYAPGELPEAVGRPVRDVEGIGPTYAARMEEVAGIITCGQLRQANPEQLAEAIPTTTDKVRSWQRMIHLMDIKGIGPQYAEILVMAGVQSPRQLAEASPAKLKAAIDAIEERRTKKRVLKVNVEIGLVERLVGYARRHVGID